MMCPHVSVAQHIVSSITTTRLATAPTPSFNMDRTRRIRQHKLITGTAALARGRSSSTIMLRCLRAGRAGRATLLSALAAHDTCKQRPACPFHIALFIHYCTA
jgi:hypothetical protein